ncbi:MAG: hypothetical protein HC780_12255 [Leptolyngbyaceae cyanobacterium CSU_1_3]|nr:hypothetical protein [Leptolyngbyaceae cyanobacterium CSU_1_3]
MSKPVFSKITRQDQRLLEQRRLSRLQQLFTKTLGLCSLKISRGNRLSIHCPEPWLVDRLLEDLEHLLYSARLVVGVSYLSICYAGEEVYRKKTCQYDNSMPAR